MSLTNKDMLQQLVDKLLEVLPPQLSQELAKQPAEIVVAGIIVLVTLLVILGMGWFSSSGKRRRSLVIVAGPCSSGKTTLFYQLKDSSVHNGTVASMQENMATVPVKNERGSVIRHVTVLDVPGHERLRYKLEQHLKEACAVILVVDAADITPHKVEAAEELFEVLTHASIANGKVPVLVACNKSDLEQAHSVDFVRKTLEKQLDSMRKTRTTLSAESAAKARVLGKPDKPLTFASLRNPVFTASISALKGDLSQLYRFLASSV